MAQTIDEITANYTDEKTGVQLVEELDKVILSRGSWTTIIFKYREFAPKTNTWSLPKARIERFQKRNGEFRSQSRFKITSPKQAMQIVQVLNDWFKDSDDAGYTEEA